MPLDNAHLSVTPPSAGRLVAGLSITTLLCILGASQLQYSKKEYVDGYLQSEGGELRVVAPTRGLVTFKVKPNETVQVGQPLASIRKAESLTAGGSLQASQQRVLDGKALSIKAELLSNVNAFTARLGAITNQLSMARAAILQSTAEVRLRSENVALEEKKIARQIALRDRGFVSETAIEQAQSDLLARRAEEQSAERSVTQNRSQVASLEADFASTQAQLKSQQEQLNRELASLEQQAAESRYQSEVEVKAPQQTTVTAITTASGDTVEAGQLLAKLAPLYAHMEVTLLLPPTSAGRIKPGQVVNLQMAAYPYQTYGLVRAKIEQVDRSPMLSDEPSLHSNGVAPGTLVTKATASVVEVPKKMGGLDALRNGMQCRASIETERMSFLSWMTWPFLKNFK